MGENKLESLLLGLKSTDKEKVYCSLMKIRNSIIKDNQGIQQFYQAGGLKLVVDLLKYPNQKNLDMTLSILGNCCIQENCSVAVGRMKVSEILVNIIQSIASDSILCRTCRLIANLSTHRENAESFYSVGVVWSLSSILKNHLELIEQSKESTLSLGTIAMTIRALGIFWSIENCRDDIISVGAVKIVVSILAHHETRNNSDILEFTNLILKALVTMTTLTKRENNSNICDYLSNQICCDDKIINVITNIINRNVEKSDNNKKSKQIKVNSKLGLTILCNLCKLDQCRDILGKSTALPTLMSKIDSEEGFKGLILLCQDKRVHAKARTSGALRTLLKSIKKTESKRKISLVLDVLGRYILDKNIIFELVDDGLIGVLIAVVNCYIESMNCLVNPMKNCKHSCSNHPKCNAYLREEETSKEQKSKFKRNLETKCDIAFKKLLIDGNNSQFTYYLSTNPSSPYSSSRALWSPQSDSTGYSSMDATPPRRDSIASDDFESYSPVCSDNEGEADYTNNDRMHLQNENPEDISRFNDIDELYEDECDSALDEDSPVLNEFEVDFLETKEDCNQDIFICVRLLQQVTFYGCIIPQLAQAETILPLLKFIIKSSQGIKHAIHTFKEILGRVEYLKSLLKTDLVLEMFKVISTDISECKQCIKVRDRIIHLRSHLQKTAESPCGVGEIENILCLGSKELKRKYILEVSLLIDSVSVLKKVLYKFGALEALTKLLVDPLYKKSALLAYINYGKVLGKPDPSKITYFKNDPSNDFEIPKSTEDKITFITNDGYKACIDRKILIEKSDVFEAMLNSDFIENKGVIYLNDVEEESLKYFLKLLYLDLKDTVNINPPLPNTIKSATEALMLTDKYLLADLNSFLCKVIVQFILKPCNVYEIYEQSLMLRMENLKQECLAYILNNSQATREICDMLNSDLRNDLVKSFILDIEDLFKQSI